MPVRVSTRATLLFALLTFVLAAIWLTMVPETLRPSTYASLAVLLTALAAITMKTLMAGQATGSLATMLYETERKASAHNRTASPGTGR